MEAHNLLGKKKLKKEEKKKKKKNRKCLSRQPGNPVVFISASLWGGRRGNRAPGGCQAQECRMAGTAGLAVPSIIPGLPPEQSCRQQLPSPCQRRLPPLAQNANPVPRPRQGRSKHTNQLNSSASGIGGGSRHCHAAKRS